jgi:hypothetical protein
MLGQPFDGFLEGTPQTFADDSEHVATRRAHIAEEHLLRGVDAARWPRVRRVIDAPTLATQLVGAPCGVERPFEQMCDDVLDSNATFDLLRIA